MSELKDRLGKCYSLSIDELTKYPDAELVHGSIQYNGQSDYPRINHAWVELPPDGDVVDAVLGVKLSYNIHTVVFAPEEHCRHTLDEVARAIEKYEHAGPWIGFCDEQQEPV